jgi:hypothetical protein
MIINPLAYLLSAICYLLPLHSVSTLAAMKGNAQQCDRKCQLRGVQLVQLRVLVAGTRYIHGIRTTEH